MKDLTFAYVPQNKKGGHIQSLHSALGEEAICARLLPDYHIVSTASAITWVEEKWEREAIMWVPG